VHEKKNLDKPFYSYSIATYNKKAEADEDNSDNSWWEKWQRWHDYEVSESDKQLQGKSVELSSKEEQKSWGIKKSRVFATEKKRLIKKG
jgi:hypothetical protein